MRLLLDTHSFLWFIMGESKLSDQALKLIEDENTQKLVSIACLWEIAIKYSLNKLTLTEPFQTLFPKQLQVNGMDLLHITVDHLTELTKLPFHHRDPFDRLIIAQAIVENLPILSIDSVFDDYPVKRLWK